MKAYNSGDHHQQKSKFSFKTKTYYVKVPLNVNDVGQDFTENSFLTNYEVKFKRGILFLLIIIPQNVNFHGVVLLILIQFNPIQTLGHAVRNFFLVELSTGLLS